MKVIESRWFKYVCERCGNKQEAQGKLIKPIALKCDFCGCIFIEKPSKKTFEPLKPISRQDRKKWRARYKEMREEVRKCLPLKGQKTKRENSIQ